MNVSRKPLFTENLRMFTAGIWCENNQKRNSKRTLTISLSLTYRDIHFWRAKKKKT